MNLKCIRVKQPIGEFYLAALSSDFLQQVTYSREASFLDTQLEGTQRVAQRSRVNEIREYISTVNAAFPNTIILAANYYDDDRLEVDEDKRWKVEKIGDEYQLEIPKEELRICSIIDGQHRIRGFKNSNISMELPCSIFIDLPPSLQAYIFATINFNQKKVDKSLAYQLFGYQLDESDRMAWSPDILAVKISRVFNKSGPFEGRIRLIKSPDDKLDVWTISSAAFVEGVVSLITGNAKADKYQVNKRKVTGYGSRSDLEDNPNYPLRSFYIQGNDKAISSILEKYFSAVSATLWNDRQPDDIVFRTVGIAAQFAFLKEILASELVRLDANLSFYDLLEPLRDIDLRSDYFSPRTATKKRLVDVFKLSLNMVNKSEVDGEILTAIQPSKS